MDTSWHSIPCKQTTWAMITSLRAGCGKCMVLRPQNKEELRLAVRMLREEHRPFALLGNGTNLIGADEDGFFALQPSAACGNAFAPLTAFLQRHAALAQGGLSALAGIPGTLGGAAAMNAGACGESIGPHILQLDGIRLADGAPWSLRPAPEDWGYRSSPVPPGILLTQLHFQWNDVIPQQELQLIQAELRRRRNVTPEGASAGSVFRNPSPNLSAGRLLEAAGCKGLSSGPFLVSLQHANWITNPGRQPGREEEVRSLLLAIRKKLPPDSPQLCREVRFVKEILY